MVDPMILAIIPARGGSKRVPRKNIRPFRGKPMLRWSVDAALASGLFDEVMVSTDDSEIAEVALDAGAVVPFQRSADSADDHATTTEVLLEVLGDYHRLGARIELGCCIYATAPFLRPADLHRGLEAMQAGEFDSLFPVGRFDYPIWRSLYRSKTGNVTLNFPEHLNARSQDLPTAYHDAGQWYWFQPAALKRHGTLMGPNAGSIILPGTQVQDIDTEEDWKLAEQKHETMFG